MENFQVYRDIQARTGGDIYIGVVGPVRTGKSTFIRRFMELVALPGMDEKMQKEVRDQLPSQLWNPNLSQKKLYQLILAKTGRRKCGLSIVLVFL